MKADKEFLDAIRTQIEYYLCKREGVKSKEVSDFEDVFNDMKEHYPDLVGEMEAGAHEKAPNNKQYLIAQRITAWLSDQMKLDTKIKEEFEED